MPLTILPSHFGVIPDAPLPYTASPWKLLWEDIRLFFRCLWLLPGLIFPITPWNSGDLDEFYPSRENLGCVVLQLALSIVQLLFLISLPVCVIFMAPALWISLYMALVLVLNKVICDLLINQGAGVLVSRIPETVTPEHEREHWIFINGVSVGRSWLQQSIDRLGYTFGRKITGVHNPTCGLVFDIIQVLIQRNFSYATQDVRDAYAIAKMDLLDPRYKKVVIIVHSQGGIEAGLIVDWLLDELPQELLRKLEVYTFGNAANHFNNPYCVYQQSHSSNSNQPIQASSKRDENTVLHIEHYANSGDFVSAWGVLNFTAIPNRYMGQVFVRPGSGHQFNQHYMDTMFTLGPDRRVLDSNDFMNMDMEVDSSAPGSTLGQEQDKKDGVLIAQRERSSPSDETEPSTPPTLIGTARSVKVRDLSRLWQYRNGGSPVDIETEDGTLFSPSSALPSP